MQVLDDTTVRLSTLVINGENGSLICGEAPCPSFVVFTAADGPTDVPASFVSVVGVNGVSTVPEPGVGVLFGAVLIGLARRVRGRRTPPSRD
jgi:hypothetical protein